MKHYIKCMIAAAAVMGMASCANEGIFEYSEPQGAMDCKSLSVDYVNSGNTTRASEDLLPEFNIRILKKEGNEDIGKNFKYAEMPEILTLPVGTYYAEAIYGENVECGWDSPYYVGISDDIVIEENKITQAPNPVMCRLKNIRMRVNMDGISEVASEVVVKVSVGVAGNSLNFDENHNGQAGYFKYYEGSNTISATFSGTVNNTTFENVELKLYTDAEPGNSYVINLTVDKPVNEAGGGVAIGSGLTINTTVDTENVNFKVEPDTPNESAEESRENDRKNPTEGTGEDA